MTYNPLQGSADPTSTEEAMAAINEITVWTSWEDVSSTTRKSWLRYGRWDWRDQRNWALIADYEPALRALGIQPIKIGVKQRGGGPCWRLMQVRGDRKPLDEARAWMIAKLERSKMARRVVSNNEEVKNA